MNYIYNREEDRHYIMTNKTTFPPQISPKEIAERPTDPYRVIPFLEELRHVWDKSPEKTFGQTLARILHDEYGYDKTGFIESITDDELLASIQNYLKDN